MAKKKNKKEKSEKKKKVEEPEEKIDEAKEEPKIVESFLKNIPFFGDFFKELGKTKVFKKRFEEANKQIQENLQRGEKKGWDFQAHISTRSIIKEKEETPKQEIAVEKDYMYVKKDNVLTIAIKVPKEYKENTQIKLENNKLILKGKEWEKIINLPERFRIIRKKQYKKGILVLELIK